MKWLNGPTALAALAGVAAAAVVLSVAELIGAFFTARATPVLALGSTFIDFTPPWLKDFAIATFGTGDKAALFVGMGLTIFVLACVLGVVAYRKWALGVAGVMLMGAGGGSSSGVVRGVSFSGTTGAGAVSASSSSSAG